MRGYLKYITLNNRQLLLLWRAESGQVSIILLLKKNSRMINLCALKKKKYPWLRLAGFAISLGLPSMAAHTKTFKNCFKILLCSFQNHAINTDIAVTAISLGWVCMRYTYSCDRIVKPWKNTCNKKCELWHLENL